MKGEKLMFTLIMFQWLPESARFQIASGQSDKALETLKKVAAENGKPMLLGRLVVDDTIITERGCIKDLLISQLRVTSILLWFIWLVRVWFKRVHPSVEFITRTDPVITSLAGLVALFVTTAWY